MVVAAMLAAELLPSSVSWLSAASRSRLRGLLGARDNRGKLAPGEAL